jgi:hypothetical protein
MEGKLIDQIMGLKNKPLEELRAKYVDLFKGETPTSNNKVFLWRKIAYRLQEIEYGGLSAEAQTRINNLIDRYDPINNKMFRPQKSPGKVKNKERDTRLPMPGAILRKTYKGQLLEVKVLEKGFEYQNQHYKTLSAVAKAITGIHWNGYLFFRP